MGYGYSGVHGEVCLWGKIWEHELGYRAQYAYPKNLTISVTPFTIRKVMVSPFTVREAMAQLEMLVEYGVDLFLAPSVAPDDICERTPVWSQEFGFTPRAHESIAELSRDIVMGTLFWRLISLGHEINWRRPKSDGQDNCVRCGQLVAIAPTGESWGDALEQVCPGRLPNLSVGRKSVGLQGAKVLEFRKNRELPEVKNEA